MDDGNSWIGIVLFAASVILFAVMYGFGAAVQALNTSALEDERDEGNKRAEKLLKMGRECSEELVELPRCLLARSEETRHWEGNRLR